MDKNLYAEQIDGIRSRGGNVIVSFGGEGGTELAIAEPDPVALEAKYQSVIDQYKFTWLDFDIEGKALSQNPDGEPAAQRRSRPAAGEEESRPDHLLYTRRLIRRAFRRELPGGLLAEDAKAQGVEGLFGECDDDGLWRALVEGKKMSDVSIASALKAREQCQAIDPAIQIGLTPMIGQNDEKGEVFTLEDAQALKAWADTQPWICSLSFWSVNRDTGKPGRKGNGNTTSGIPQKPWDYTLIFKAVHHGAVTLCWIEALMTNDHAPMKKALFER